MTFRSIRIIFFLLAVAVVLLLVLPPAFADEDHSRGYGGGGGNDSTMPGNVSVTTGSSSTNMSTSISTGGNRAIALGNVLGDVDIAGCLGSTQWSTPLYGRQKLVINWPCMAEFYLRNAKYGLAAMALCNTEILGEFATEAECELAHDFAPAELLPALANLYDQAAQFDGLAAQQEEEIEYLKEEQATLVGRIDYLTERIEQAPARAPAPAIVQQAPQEQYTNEQFDAVWAALAGGDKDE